MASHALDELLELLMSEREDVRNQAYLAVARKSSVLYLN